MLATFNRPSEDNEECNHKDGNKLNNYISNLEWRTHKENCLHRDKVLLRVCGKKGEEHPSSKLNNQQVREVRVLLRDTKLTQQQIADKYGVTNQLISCINLNKIWRDV